MTFVSRNHVLNGKEVTVAVGDGVRFHPTGRPSSYLGRVIEIEAQRVRVVVQKNFSGRGNTDLHRWRVGHRTFVDLNEIHEVLARST